MTTSPSITSSRAARAARPPGRTWSRRARRAICARAIWRRSRRGCFRDNTRSRRRCTSSTATDDCFRRTICTIAGWIIYTGIPSSIR